jgi:1,2-diacylglycerol 3-beta-galactosyltransferase
LYGPVVDRLPRPWGLLWHSTNGQRRSLLLLRLVAPLALNRLNDIVLASEPDVIVSTHPFANHLPVWLMQRTKRKLPVITVVTDPISIHYWWLCPEVDLCLVATEQARVKALEAGLAPEKVKVIGMPVSLEFGSPTQTKPRLRDKLGLHHDRLTVLVAGGGDGMGNVYPTARAVAQADLHVQLVVVTGRNDGLKARLEAVPWEVPTTIFGFVDNMPELMHASDVLVTKAGPSTISEALSCGLPMLVSGALRGQEEGNAEWVAETGAAIPTPTSQALVAALRGLAHNGNERLLRMGRRAREAARPEAVLDAAELIDEIASGSV